MKKSIDRVTKKTVILITIMLISIYTAAYAFFSMPNNPGLTHNITVANELDVSYILSATSNLNLTVDPINPVNNTVMATSSVNTDFVQLTNNTGTGAICRYEIWYTPITTFNNSSLNTENLKEFTLSGTDSTGQNASFEFDLNDVSSASQIYEGTITVPAGQTLRQNWTFTLTHYNLDLNQNSLLNHTYTGKITFRAKKCSENTLDDSIYLSTFVSDQDLTPYVVADEGRGYRYEGVDPNNYVCFSSTCTDSTLYRIVGKFEEMIDTDNDGVADTKKSVAKLVKYQTIGYGAWNSTSGGTSNWANATLKTILNNQWSGPTNKAITTRYNLPNGTYTDSKYAIINIDDYKYGVLESDCSRDVRVIVYSYTPICYQKNWLYMQNVDGLTYWTISADSINDTRAYVVSHNSSNRAGDVLYSSITGNGYIYPSFYVDATDVRITSGNGSRLSPYLLS